MHPARIAELLEPFLGPSNDQRLSFAGSERSEGAVNLDDISTYIDILQRWNARINLTAIRGAEEIVTRHFGESFFAARHLFPRTTPLVGAAPAVADVGSGAGFPGIPLKLWAPQIRLTLIESSHKKATFLREVARALILTDINIQPARAETLAPAIEEKFDVVTLRAVERFESILPVAASLVAPSGRLALLIGSAQAPQAQSLLPSAAWSNPLPIPKSQSRILLIGTLHTCPPGTNIVKSGTQV